MKKLFIFLLIPALVGISCSGSTRLIASYIQEDMPAKKFQKIAIIALANSEPNRLAIEEAIANTMKARDINAMSTFFLFPLAGRSDVIADMNVTQEEIKAWVKQKVEENNIDGLMIISVLDARSVERYVQDPGVSLYINYGYPVYGYNYYDYYWYAFNTTGSSGYYLTETTYFVETNFYDTATGELLWTGQTKTENITSIDDEAPKFAKVIVYDMINKGVIGN